MSAEIFLGVSQIRKFEEEHFGLGGKSREAMLSTAIDMAKEGAVAGAIDEILGIAQHTDDAQDVIDDQHFRGVYLFGVTLGTSDYHRVVHAPYDVVAYAHAEDRQGAEDRFSLVHMAVWMRRGSFSDPLGTQQTVIDLCLADPSKAPKEHGFQAVPIAGDAIIAPFRDEDFAPYVYDFKKHYEAVRGVDLPAVLMANVLGTIHEHHSRSLGRLARYTESRTIRRRTT
jgi:hypothetical protein